MTAFASHRTAVARPAAPTRPGPRRTSRTAAVRGYFRDWRAAASAAASRAPSGADMDYAAMVMFGRD